MTSFSFSMEYQEEAEMSPILRTPNLELNVEVQHWLRALTFLEEVIGRVGEKPNSLAQGTLTESKNMQETD